jgi:hypothetical protein
MDTVTIRIQHPDFEVSRQEYFSPRAHFNTNDHLKADTAATRKDVYKKFVQHQSKYDKQNSIYKPVLTLTQRMKPDAREFEWFLNIQASIPRLIYPNNMYEISPNDDKRTFQKLVGILRAMGVETTIEAVSRAVVVKFHIGKNIILTNDYTVSQAIALIKKTVASRETKKREVQYENDGEALHFYTSSHGRIFYNKIKDYERTKVTAIDKDRLKIERLTGRQIGKEAQMLRFEVRYNGQQTVASKLRPYLGTNEDAIRFESLFDEDLWRKIVVREWEDIIGTPASRLSLKVETSPDETFKFILNHVTSTQKKNVYALNKANDLYATFINISNMGIQGYRNLLERTFSEKTIGTRLEKKMAFLEGILANMPINPLIDFIDREIRNYKRLTPTWFEENMHLL